MNRGVCLPLSQPIKDDSWYTKQAQTYFYQKDITLDPHIVHEKISIGPWGHRTAFFKQIYQQLA